MISPRRMGHFACQRRSRTLSRAAWPCQSTATTISKLSFISYAYRDRTFSGKSGASENTGQRETKFGLEAVLAVRSFSQGCPQMLGIFAALFSGREIFPRAKWRKRRDSHSLHICFLYQRFTLTQKYFLTNPVTIRPILQMILRHRGDTTGGYARRRRWPRSR